MALTAQLGAAYDLSRNARFQQRVAMALLNQVAVVASEVGTTTDHANRLAFGAQVAYDPNPWADRMSYGMIVTNANIQAAINPAQSPDLNNAAVADSDIEAAVATVWNFYADSVATLVASKVI